MPWKNTKNYSTSLHYFNYNNDYCFADKIGRYGIEQNSYNLAKLRVTEAIQSINISLNSYKILKEIDYETMVAPVLKLAEHIKKSFDNLIILGMGASTLIPQTILAMLRSNPEINIYYLNSTEGYLFNKTVKPLNLAKTAVFVLSKSGETLEVISLLGALFEGYKNSQIQNIHEHFYFSVANTNNYLNKKAKELKCQIIECDQDLSGRFSVFSAPMIFLGLIAGLDMRGFISGANAIIQDFWQFEGQSIAATSVLDMFMLKQPIVVNMSYTATIFSFLDWYSQLIAESLGKNHRGVTPLKGLGPMDQHSIFQLYLDGPKDKLFTLFYAEGDEKNKISLGSNHISDNKTLSEVHHALFRATLAALENQKLPVRVYRIPNVDCESLGALMMHVMIEVMLYGLLMEVNPFDQPAVELIKRKTRSCRHIPQEHC